MKLVVIALLVAFCSSYAVANFTASQYDVVNFTISGTVSLTGTSNSSYTAALSLVSSLVSDLSNPSGTLSTLYGYLANLVATLSGDVNAILNLIAVVTNDIDATVLSLNGIINTAQLYARLALPYLLALLQNVVNQKVQILLTVVDFLQQALAAAIAAGSLLVAGIKSALAQVILSLEAALQQAISFGLTLVANVLTFGQQEINAAVATVQSLTYTFESELFSHFEYLVNALVNGANLTVAQIQYFVNQIVGAIGALLNVVGQDYTAIANASLDVKAALYARLITLLNAVLLDIQSVLANLQSLLSNASGTVAAALTALITSVESIQASLNVQLSIAVTGQAQLTG